jgi:hypothetical protein
MEEESKTDLDKEREELLIQVKRVMIEMHSGKSVVDHGLIESGSRVLMTIN